MLFSLPYIDQPESFWQNLQNAFKDKIYEIYFPINPKIVSSGRPVQKNQYLYSFLTFTELNKSVLVNPIVLPHPFERLEDIILHELEILNREYRVNNVTVTDLQLCHSIKQNLPQYKVTASVLMRLNGPEQIAYIENQVDSIVLDTAIVRDLDKIKMMRRNFSGMIKIIVNEGCLPYCPFRNQHFYEMSLDLPYPKSLCRDLLNDQPWMRLKSAWILPQHLHYYTEYVDIIKLAGRVTLQDPDKYLKVAHAYIEGARISADQIGSGPAGMIEDMPISDDLFYTTITCKKNCHECQICKRYYQKYSRSGT